MTYIKLGSNYTFFADQKYKVYLSEHEVLEVADNILTASASIIQALSIGHLAMSNLTEYNAWIASIGIPTPITTPQEPSSDYYKQVIVPNYASALAQAVGSIKKYIIDQSTDTRYFYDAITPGKLVVNVTDVNLTTYVNIAFMGDAVLDTNPYANGVPASPVYWYATLPGTYTLFKDSSNASIVVSSDDLTDGKLRLSIRGAVTTKVFEPSTVVTLAHDLVTTDVSKSLGADQGPILENLIQETKNIVFKTPQNTQAFRDVQDAILQIQLLDGFDKTKKYGLQTLLYKAGVNTGGITLYISDVTANSDYSVIAFNYTNTNFTVSTNKANIYELISGIYKIRIKFNLDKLPSSINSPSVKAEFSNYAFTNALVSSAEMQTLLGADNRLAILENGTKLENINNLSPYSLGKSHTWASGSTGYQNRIGVLIPSNFPPTLKITLVSTFQIPSILYWQNANTDIATPAVVEWVADGKGAYYFEVVFQASDITLESLLFLFISNQTTLGQNVTVTFTSLNSIIELPALKQQVNIIQAVSDDLTTRASNIETKQSAIDGAIKKPNIDISAYADKQSLVIAQGETNPLRLTWTIPISKFSNNDLARVQFKSLNGVNSNNTYLFKYVESTFIGQFVWTLNNSDGFYYSQIFNVNVSQSDIDTYSDYTLLLQAYKGNGLAADTISIVTQLIIKNGYVDVNALSNQVANIATPPNLINTLELLWRGYASMTPKSVKKDGTGDYTTIQAAYNAINDAAVNRQYDIQVYDDFSITDITQLVLQGNTNAFNNQTSDVTNSIVLFKTKNWVHVRGMNSEKLLKIKSPTNLTAASYQNIQVVYPEGNCIIRNFKSVIQGGRYSFHQEANGLTSSPDYHATTFLIDIHEVHLGNFESDGYPAGSWASTQAEADGTTSGFKKFMIRCKLTSANPTPFYFHSNKDFDEPTEHHFINHQIISAKNSSATACDVRYADIGSGQRSLIEIIGCSWQKMYIDNNIRCSETTMTRADFYMNGGANITGYSNAPMTCFLENPKTLCFKAVANGTNIDVTGGTAYSAIFGGELKRYLGSVDKGGAIWGTKRIQNPWGAPYSQIFSLPYRLGNCASVNKTLIIRVGSTNYTITFNQNYMTADGSSYSYNTSPAIPEADILAYINSLYPSIFQVENGALLKMYTFIDCIENGVNVSAATINIGKGVIRDVANGWNTWRLAQTGEKAEAICGERLNPGAGENYDTAQMISIKKAIFPADTLGISATVGLYYKCGSNGGFISTVTPSEACLYAIDGTSLIGI